MSDLGFFSSISNSAASSGKAESKNEVTYKDTNQVMHNPEETPTQSLDIADESSRRLHLAQVSTTRSIELTSDKVTIFSIIYQDS